MPRKKLLVDSETLFLRAECERLRKVLSEVNLRVALLEMQLGINQDNIRRERRRRRKYDNLNR